MQKLNFSLCLISRNEEKTLPKLVGSLKEFQECGGLINIVDTGSTDNTVKVARDLGCNVVEVGERFLITIDDDLANKINEHFVVDGEQPIVKTGDKQFDYSAARNFAATLSQHDFIFTPDCDEAFTTFNIDEIIKTIDSGVEQLEYNFVFSHQPDGSPAIKFTHCKAYDRRKLHWTGIIHEVLSGEAKRQFVGEDIIYLEHYQNIETNRGHYLRGLAVDCYNNPESDRNSHYLGRELLWNGRPKTALKEFKRHIEMNKWHTERAQSMIFIGDIYKQLGLDELAVEWYNKSFLLESGRREALIKLAQFYYEKNDPQKVACYIGAALEIKESGFYANDISHYTNYPHELMYWAKWQLGDYKDSKKHWNKAFEYQPHHNKYLHDARFYIDFPKVSFIIPTLGREEGLKACIESIKRLNYPPEKVEIIVKQDSVENRIGVPHLLAQGINESTGEWIVFASNDTIFMPNSLIEAMSFDNYGFTAFNTGKVSEDEGNICEHFMIRKDIIEQIGEVFDTEFYHVGVDNLLWAKMKKLGIAQRCPDAIVIHNHFTRGADFDEVYKIGWDEEKVKHDRELLKQKLEALTLT